MCFGYGQLSTISIPGNWPGFSHTHSEYASVMNCECSKSSLVSEAHVTLALIRSEVQQSVSFTFYPVCTHACLWAVLMGGNEGFVNPDFVWGYPESLFINILESASLVQTDNVATVVRYRCHRGSRIRKLDCTLEPQTPNWFWWFEWQLHSCDVSLPHNTPSYITFRQYPVTFITWNWVY